MVFKEVIRESLQHHIVKDDVVTNIKLVMKSERKKGSDRYRYVVYLITECIIAGEVYSSEFILYDALSIIIAESIFERFKKAIV